MNAYAGGGSNARLWRSNVDAARRTVAAYLALTAVVVAANLILTPVYHNGDPDYPVWKIVNYFMAAGAVVALAVACMRRRSARAESGGLDYLRAAFSWYGAIALAMLFFWEWFWQLNPDSETGDAVTSHIVYFPIVDALYVAVTLSLGCYLWRLSPRN